MIIKICGITTSVDFKCVVESGASAAGFLAWPQSPRFVKSTVMKQILSSCNALEPFRKVVVFVNPGIKDVTDYVNAGANVVQLHGDESPDFAERIASYAEIWKVLKPQKEEDVLKYVGYPAKYFLIDVFNPVLQGGTGKLADWKLASFAVEKLNAPVILAGGLNPQNVAEAIKQVRPAGVDVSSGVELSPGVKVCASVNKFVSAAKQAAAEL